MIFDRTQNDVDTAILLRKEKVQTFQDLTESEEKVLEKGFLTYNTLNRIENKQEELRNLLEEMLYVVEDMTHSYWTAQDFFSQKDFDRLVENNDKLKKAFFVYKDTPVIPNNNYRKFETINAVEKILHDLDAMINDIKSNYRICGVAVCGE